MELYLVKGSYMEQTSYLMLFGNKAIMVDCGVEYRIIEDFLKSKNAVLHAIFVTHGHFDHSFGVAEAQKHGVKIYASEFGVHITMTNKDLARFVGVHFERYSADCPISGNQTIDLPFVSVKCIYTPGHTIDGMCYIIEDILFSGDTIATSQAFGNLRFPTGSKTKLVSSLYELFNNYPDYMCLHGHEDAEEDGIYPFSPSVTVGYTRIPCRFDLFASITDDDDED